MDELASELIRASPTANWCIDQDLKITEMRSVTVNDDYLVRVYADFPEDDDDQLLTLFYLTFTKELSELS